MMEEEKQKIEVSLDAYTVDEFCDEWSQQVGYIERAIRGITETGDGGNALVGIAQGLFDVAQAIREHTEYLKSRDHD